MKLIAARAIALYRRHQDFFLLAILFASFRLFTILLFRPGGLLADSSDYDYYRALGDLTNWGYYPFINLWSAYPPLFPWLIVAVYRLAINIPSWTDPRLWFNLLLGSALLVFEVGNLVLIYALALRIYALRRALRCSWLYAGLFIPVLTLTGWFENMPLFFLLLSLYFLVGKRPALSGVAAGLGFMVKLTPIVLLPLGLKAFPRLSQRAAYALAAAVSILVVAVPFLPYNPRLLLAPFQMMVMRRPWETVWALLEGNYTYGIIEADVRNLGRIGLSDHVSGLPWSLIGLCFLVVYLWLYTRRIDWQGARQQVAFAALTLDLVMLYSKGFSPQFLVWFFPFIVLLLPNLTGILYLLVLSSVNVIEWYVYFVMFPGEHWLLAAVVLIRTVLLLGLGWEWYLALFPGASPLISRIRQFGWTAMLLILIVGGSLGAKRLAETYYEARYRQSEAKAAMDYVRGEASRGTALVFATFMPYREFYPFLHREYVFYVLHDYAPGPQTLEGRLAEQLGQIAGAHEELWLILGESTSDIRLGDLARNWLQARYDQVREQQFGPVRLLSYRKKK